MAVIDASYHTDAACPWSWALEPSLRRLRVEFGERAAGVPTMIGCAPRKARPVAAAPPAYSPGRAGGIGGSASGSTAAAAWFSALTASQISSR